MAAPQEIFLVVCGGWPVAGVCGRMPPQCCSSIPKNNGPLRCSLQVCTVQISRRFGGINRTFQGSLPMLCCPPPPPPQPDLCQLKLALLGSALSGHRKHGPSWPASPLGRARPSRSTGAASLLQLPAFPSPPTLPTLPCSTNSTRATKDSAVYMYACCMCVCVCVSLWVYSIQSLYYSPSLPSSPARQLAIQRCIPTQLAWQSAIRRCWPLLPCTSFGDPMVHPFPAVCVPPCSPPVPAPSCMLLLFFQVPQDAHSSPPDGGRSRLP